MAVDDIYTKSLLHFDGANGSTTFTDESGKTWTANGNAQISTATSVFGGASGLFDGSGDYISSADNADWFLDDGLDSTQWTIDFRLYFVSSSGITPIISQVTDTNNYWQIIHSDTANQLSIACVSGGSALISVANSFTKSNATWYHIAVVKEGTTGYKFFVDGTQVGTTQTSGNSLQDLSSTVLLGRGLSGVTPVGLNGYIDEFRLSKGIARWTSNFSPPGIAYAPNLSTGMMSFLFS